MAFKRTTKVLSDTAMSSMTDLVFLLLIFFLITSTLVNPNALKLLLPKSTGQVSAKPTVTVSIKEVVSLMNIAKRNHYKVILATQPE